MSQTSWCVVTRFKFSVMFNLHILSLQNLFFYIFWNFTTDGIFWQLVYGHMSILMYRELAIKVSKYRQFILQKPYVQSLDLMSKDGHKVLLLYFYKKPQVHILDIRSWLEQPYVHSWTWGLNFFCLISTMKPTKSMILCSTMHWFLIYHYVAMFISKW